MDSAGCWFLRSGIQEPHGGVARYYRSDTKRNARISTEITGYALSTLLYLYDRTGREEFLESALRSADFLTRCAWDGELGSFPFEYPAAPDRSTQQLSYFFDTGIIIRGLLAVWRLTAEAEYLDVAVRAGVSLSADFRGSAQWDPVIALPEKRSLPFSSKWSGSPGCYQLKSAMAWFELSEATGDGRFFPWYNEAVDAALRSEQSFLPAMTDEQTMDRLHAYGYFLEGLLPVCQRPNVRNALAEGLQRMSGFLRQIAPVFERSDVYAQILRVRMFADQLASIPLDRTEAEHEAEKIAEFQLEHADPCIAGGFCFGRKGPELLPFVNPVSTAFCLQALDMWSSYRSGTRLIRQSLI